MAKQFDLVVLGAGPGGYVAAIRGAQLGMKVAIVEKQYWGGVCLNVGCIPSKALLRNAEIVHIVRDEAKTFGIKFDGEVSFDYGEAFRRSRKVADGRVKGVHYLMKKNKIEQFNGWASFTGPNAMDVQLNDGKSETISFKNCVIATGATTRLIPGSQLSERVVTYEEQIMEDSLPKSIIIAGGGAIGVEFAYVMKNYGVKVTIVEFLDRLVPLEDEEVSAELAKQYKRAGIEVSTSTRVDKIEDTGSNVKVTVTRNGKQEVLEADKVLQAIGFQPRTQGYGLEKTGVELTERGAIAIDGRMRTNVPGIYAIGDVTAKLMLAHVAETMGIVAAETMAGVETKEVDYVMAPRATYCQPQIASFGWTEKQAREKYGDDVKVAKFPFSANAKAHGLNDIAGFVKLISEAKYGELLGGHLIGPDVTELLPELTLAQQWELTTTEMSRNIHAHPTLSEALKEAIHGLEGHMINM